MSTQENEKCETSTSNVDIPEEIKPGPHPADSNPYHFPERALFKGRTYNGVPVSNKLPVTDDPVTHMKKVRDLPMRDDDVIITAFPKCGTHWVSEILHMLTSGSTSFSNRTKEFAMLEFHDDLPALASEPSPRVLNSHLRIALLPRTIVEKKVKLVHLIRNPKDTVVSLFYHVKANAPDELNFDNFLKGYTTEGYTCNYHQLNYLRQMSEFEKAHPDHPIIHIHYEDLKKDPIPIIAELSEFMGCPATETFCQEVASACGFDKMKQADDSRVMPDNLKTGFPKKMTMYRKGVVGDWKNTFTVAQNEMYDEFIRQQQEKGFGYTFREYN